METYLQPYQEAITSHVHAVCIDRNLDPHSRVKTEAACRIERFLPELVGLARAVGPEDLARFEGAFEHTICLQCGNQNALGVCREREAAACCLYRYLPLIYDAIHRVEPVSPLN